MHNKEFFFIYKFAAALRLGAIHQHGWICESFLLRHARHFFTPSFDSETTNLNLTHYLIK